MGRFSKHLRTSQGQSGSLSSQLRCVLGFPIKDDGESELGKIIYFIGLWQYTLPQHGSFVRGGITVGPIYMDDDVAFGKGLLDAYKSAESKPARDPRVALAPCAMDLVHHHLAYYAEVSESPQNFSLLFDADSQMFITIHGDLGPRRDRDL